MEYYLCVRRVRNLEEKLLIDAHLYQFFLII